MPPRNPSAPRSPGAGPARPRGRKAPGKQRVRRAPGEARAEIVAAAEAALAERDFGSLTVDEVMGRTGMTRSAFYHYFSGLDELALGLLERFEHEIHASVDPWLRADEASPRATREHLTAMFEAMHRHRTAVRAVGQAAGGSPEVYRQWQSRVVDGFIRDTADFIRRQVARGCSRARDPERLARALILMNNAVANDALLDDDADEPSALARVVADVWNAAIFGSTV